MAGDVEEVGNRIMNGNETLQMPLRLEAFHDPLSPSDWLVGILCPIVQMGWLPPSPDGIAMCQVGGVERHETERTAI